MITSKPISTISYNSNAFLFDKLVELQKRDLISFFAWVEHQPEEDEKKSHKHLYVMPSKQLNTSEFERYFEEVDLNNDKPLRILPCQSSKFADWFLYSCHNKEYLALKGQKRQYHYSKEDFITSDVDFFNELIHTIDYQHYRKTGDFLEYIQLGYSFEQLLFMGIIPINQVLQYERFFNIVKPLCQNDNLVERAGRLTHTKL